MKDFIICIVGSYIITGLILCIIASIRSTRYEFYEDDLKVFIKLIFTWPWRYKILADKVK